jgi:hypothetical protein
MLRSLFVIVIMSVGIVAGLFNRFAALLLYIWFALFRPQEWLWVDITGLHLSLILGLLLVIPSLGTGILPDLTHPISIGMILSLVAFLVGGAFIALSLNDLTWYTFSFVAALDRLSRHNVQFARPSAYGPTSRPDLLKTTYISDPRSSLSRSIHSCSSLA